MCFFSFSLSSRPISEAQGLVLKLILLVDRSIIVVAILRTLESHPLALLKTNVILPVQGKRRRIVILRENSKGDLYLTYPVLRAGEDPAGPLVRELRVSLHPSWQGSHTTIKQQTQLRGGEPLSKPTFASTTAVRNVSEGRFFPVRGDI